MISVEQVKMVDLPLMQAIKKLFPQLTESSPIPDEAAIIEIVNSQASSLWIAKNADCSIVGMLSLVIYRTTTGIHAWIEDVVVDQNARRGGVAEQLTKAAIEFAQQSGAKAVSLTSRPARAAANQLYQKLGFQLIDTNLYRMNLN
jgi:ribosomal protein S18 acetylase RimI-like enzyme